MKYTVSMRVVGYYVVDVEADSAEAAKEKAEIAFSEADFGELQNIDGEVSSYEDENNSETYLL